MEATGESGGHEPAKGEHLGIAVRCVAPLSPMQRMTASHLATSHQQTAPVTLLGEAEADALLRLRERLNQERNLAGEARYSVTHLMMKIVAAALQRHPGINAGLIEGQRHEWSEINIGVALALPDGNLIVPVVRGVDRKSLADVASELSQLEARGAQGKLALADVRGGTFTLTNVGMIKSVRWTTPIIHLPQCAILGLGAIRPAPVVRNGQLAVGNVLPTSLTFDHRLVNGHPASTFVDTLHELIASADQIRIQ